jgi:YD repeat-containing protein
MGYYVDVFQEDGGKTHFKRVKSAAGEPDQLYRAEGGMGQAVFLGNVWRVNGLDGWTWLFPYRPQALPQYVTVLTSFTDPGGHLYKMERNNFGDLLSVTTPSGKWLHFENDAQHRIRAITSSVGRTVEYEYDEGSRLIRVKDSDGHEDRYTYDGQGRMLTVARGAEKPILTNRYATDGYIKDQTLADGRKFEYWTYRTSRNVADETEITDPNGLHTFIQYGPNGYTQSLPTPTPH